LNLLPSDKDIQDRIVEILDENGDGEIDGDEFLQNIAEVLPVLAEPGEEMKVLLVKVFMDFDPDDHGF
jgi:O-phosphoseryl-tRNA(Cys) synthetase